MALFLLRKIKGEMQYMFKIKSKILKETLHTDSRRHTAVPNCSACLSLQCECLVYAISHGSQTIIIRNQKSAFDVKKSVTQSDMIFCSKPYVLVVILCSKIRRIAVEKADGSIVLLNQLFKTLFFKQLLSAIFLRQGRS